jgi:hypothetical protein
MGFPESLHSIYSYSFWIGFVKTGVEGGWGCLQSLLLASAAPQELLGTISPIIEFSLLAREAVFGTEEVHHV